MLKKIAYSSILFLFIFNTIQAQDGLGGLRVKADSTVIVNQGIDPLSPSRAAFYSAVLPGLGQIYNKKYWKAPIAMGAVAIPVYFYVSNDRNFNRYRTAFKLERAGRPHEFDGTGTNPLLSEDALKRAQEVFKENRDLSLFIALGLYALNILEANVDAHLPDKALDRNLSFRPSLFTSPVSNQAMVGLTINFKF